MAESISQYPMVDKFLRYLQVEKNTSPLTVKNYAETAIHEQNAYPGVTTKMLAPKADRVMLAMPEAEKYLKCD